MKNKSIIFILTIIFFVNSLFAQESVFQIISRDINGICKESKDLFKKDLGKVFVLSAATGLLIYKYDEEIRNNFIDDDAHFKNIGLHNLSKTAYWYGSEDRNVVISFAGITSLYLGSGFLFDNDYNKKTARLMAESFGFTMVTAQIGKILFGRGRPVYEEGSKSFTPFKLSGDSQHSMPSGHTTAAFCMATVIAMRSDSYWVKIPAYTLALGAGLQRIESHRHWTSDVLIAGLLGHFMAKTIVNNHRKDDNSLQMNYSVVPRGMNLSLSFPL